MAKPVKYSELNQRLKQLRIHLLHFMLHKKAANNTRLFAYCKGGNFNINIWEWLGYFIC